MALNAACPSRKLQCSCWCISPAAQALALILQGVVTSAGSQTPGLLTGAIINVLVYVLGIKVLRKGLTWEGVLSSWFLGTLVFAAFGARGYAIVCSYFLLGTLVTKVRMKQKEAEGIAEARSGRRSLVSRASGLCSRVSFHGGTNGGLPAPVVSMEWSAIDGSHPSPACRAAWWAQGLPASSVRWRRCSQAT